MARMKHIVRLMAGLVVLVALVHVTTATGWAANVQADARAQWSEVIATGPDGKQRPRDLQVIVNLTGTDAAKASHFGRVRMVRAVAGGKALKSMIDRFAIEADSRTQMVRIEREGDFAQHPAEGVKFVLNFAHPGPVETVTEIRGSVTLRTGGKSTDVLVKDITRVKGAPVSRELAAAGVRLKRVPSTPDMLELAVPIGSDKVYSMTLVDKAGRKYPNLDYGKGENVAGPTYQFFGRDGKIPADAQLKVTLITGSRNVVVPLVFKALPVMQPGMANVPDATPKPPTHKPKPKPSPKPRPGATSTPPALAGGDLGRQQKAYDAKSQKIRDTYDTKINGGASVKRVTEVKINAYEQLTKSHIAALTRLADKYSRANNQAMVDVAKAEAAWAKSVLATVKAHKDKKKRKGNKIVSVAPVRPAAPSQPTRPKPSPKPKPTPMPARGIPADAVKFNGHHYKLFTQRISWTDAKTKCQEMGGHLVTIESAAENAHISEMAIPVLGPSKGGLWIGCSDADQEGQWKWVTGETVTYKGWRKGRPRKKDTRSSYGVMYKQPGDKQGAWADGSVRGGDGKGKAYICEWE